MTQKYQVRVNDREVEVELLKREGALVQFVVNGEQYEVEVQPKRQNFTGANISPVSAPITSSTQFAKKPSTTATSSTITAPMPGIIVSVAVQESTQVKSGQTVCVMEAMKMENNIPAPRDGVVKKVLVQPGKEVEAGQALIELH